MEQQLNRECSLFTEDGRYVIVGSAAHIPEDLRPHFYHIHSNNEAVTPTIRYIIFLTYSKTYLIFSSMVIYKKYFFILFSDLLWKITPYTWWTCTMASYVIQSTLE